MQHRASAWSARCAILCAYGNTKYLAWKRDALFPQKKLIDSKALALAKPSDGSEQRHALIAQ
jgi:hypothetical protein